MIFSSSRIFFTILLSFIILYSCGSKKQKEEEETVTDPTNLIVGNWRATWEMTGDDVKDFEDYQKKMKGKLIFQNNGEVKITTYGFDGCLFMTDTSTSIMNWKMEDKILRFIDKEDVHGIPYVIEELESDLVRLSLMGDIYLNLEK